MNPLFYAVPVASAIALFFAWLFYHQMKKEDEGTPTMKKIAQYVREGAMAYLKQQYKVVLIVFIVLALLFSFHLSLASFHDILCFFHKVHFLRNLP